MTIIKHYRFEAARWLPHLPPEHPCSRLHGHSFRVTVTLAGHQDPVTGMLRDYADIDAVVRPLISQLDHRCLNEVGVAQDDALLQNPTTENLCIWFFNRLKPSLAELAAVEVGETEDASARYTGES